MARADYDAKIAELQAKKERAERHQRARAALDMCKGQMRRREYAQAQATARALVADLEALAGEGGASE